MDIFRDFNQIFCMYNPVYYNSFSKKHLKIQFNMENLGFSTGTGLLQHILEKIVLYSDLKTTLNCRLVCSNWNQIIDNPRLWISNCPKDHPFGQAIFVTPLLEIVNSIIEPDSKSKFALLMLESYFIKCQQRIVGIVKKRNNCHPNHSYLIWPILIAFKKHKDISLVKRIISFVGDPIFEKIGRVGIRDVLCCFQHPRHTVQKLPYLSPNFAKSFLSICDISEKDLYKAIQEEHATGQNRNYEIVKILLRHLEDKIKIRGCKIQDVFPSISIDFQNPDDADDESEKHVEAQDRRYSCLLM